MGRVGDLLASPAVTAVMAAAVFWSPLAGFPIWSGLTRRRMARRFVVRLQIGALVFCPVPRPAAQAAA